MRKKINRDLTPQEKYVIADKGTEAPFSGKYNDFFGKGVYVCKRCNAQLYRSEDKFRSFCGWPSFDNEIEGAVKRLADADGKRTEIICSNCGAHLGHVFEGEGLTDKNVRHCVNSVSMLFIPAKNKEKYKKAYFAGGCFWGIEHLLQKHKGVLTAVSGYMGGYLSNPTYYEVCTGTTGHLEAVEVTYDPDKISYRELAELFFEIHDPTQTGGQGPDIGEQYESAVFVNDNTEKETIQELIGILESNGYNIATKILPAAKFWKAEEKHQNYYQKTGKTPYCHIYTKRF
ncbi:MAG: bifunctional methionine sulfoxide reductase B/A protein [Victivallales bacterium]|nr:bifunctional methionine sulfoxide reductase B/A protein [Victivallales bacterium]